MNRWTWRQWTGILGLVYVAIQVAALVLFLIAGNPPDYGNAKSYAGWINSNSGLFMGDAFLTAVATAVLLMQFTGIRAIIREAGDDWEWAAALFFGAGLVTAAILIVGSAAEAAAAFISGSGTEPTIVRAAWAGAWMALTFLYFTRREMGGAFTWDEIARYREGGRRTSAAIELACRAVKGRMSEHEIAGILDRARPT